MGPKPGHDPKALRDGGPEVVGAAGEVCLKEIVRPYPDPEEPVHKLLHNSRIVIDPLKEDGLTSQGNAGVRKQGTGPGSMGCYFLGMIEMGIDIKRMIAAEHADEFFGNPHR